MAGAAAVLGLAATYYAQTRGKSLNELLWDTFGYGEDAAGAAPALVAPAAAPAKFVPRAAAWLELSDTDNYDLMRKVGVRRRWLRRARSAVVCARVRCVRQELLRRYGELCALSAPPPCADVIERDLGRTFPRHEMFAV